MNPCFGYLAGVFRPCRLAGNIYTPFKDCAALAGFVTAGEMAAYKRLYPRIYGV